MRVLVLGTPDWTAPSGVSVVAGETAQVLVTDAAALDAALGAAGGRPVVVVGEAGAAASWLRAGAAEVLAPGADASEAQRALDHAWARADGLSDARAFRARYRALLGALPDLIARLRDDGTALDFYVPDEFATEFPADAMLGRRLADVIPEDLAARFAAAVAQLRTEGAAEPYRYTVTVDGETRVREARVVANGPDEVLSLLRDVTDLERSTRALEQSRADLRALAARLQAVREEERARLSRDVHDVIGQGLTAIRLVAGSLARRRPDDGEVQARIADLRQLVDETVGHVRRVSTDLRPGVLDDLGLVAALEWQARRFEERSGLTCIVETEGPEAAFAPGRLPSALGTAAFRIAQEALTNVARHAEASEVVVCLVADGDTLRLVIQDDGRGLGAPADGRRPLGLVGMRERALAAGGELTVRDAAGGGVRVCGTFPNVLRPTRP